jgi:hypothetical protein
MLNTKFLKETNNYRKKIQSKKEGMEETEKRVRGRLICKERNELKN